MNIVRNLCIWGLLLLVFSSFAQEKNELLVKTKNNTTLHYSKGIPQKEVDHYLDRVEKAISFYHELINGNEIKLDMYVLKKADWKDYSYVPMYGMPHAGYGKLIMAYDENDLWSSVLPQKKDLSSKEYEKFKKIYEDEEGKISAKIFWDLLSIHELGHLVANANNLSIPKHWFNEFFANYFLHAYIAKYESNLLDQLTEITRIDSKLLAGEKFTSLDEFENNYGSKMSGKNYVWYQVNIQQIVKSVYEKVGDKPLKLIFTKFKDNQKKFKSSQEFILYLEKEISPEIAEYFRNF